MTPSKRAIEAAARAIDKLDHRKATSMANLTRMMAEAALTAALAVDGVALVPIEPTEAMLEAAYLEPNSYWHHDTCELKTEWFDEMRAIYRAMLAAANDGEERPFPRQEKI